MTSDGALDVSATSPADVAVDSVQASDIFLKLDGIKGSSVAEDTSLTDITLTGGLSVTSSAVQNMAIDGIQGESIYMKLDNSSLQSRSSLSLADIDMDGSLDVVTTGAIDIVATVRRSRCRSGVTAVFQRLPSRDFYLKFAGLAGQAAPSSVSITDWSLDGQLNVTSVGGTNFSVGQTIDATGAVSPAGGLQATDMYMKISDASGKPLAFQRRAERPGACRDLYVQTGAGDDTLTISNSQVRTRSICLAALGNDHLSSTIMISVSPSIPSRSVGRRWTPSSPRHDFLRRGTLSQPAHPAYASRVNWRRWAGFLPWIRRPRASAGCWSLGCASGGNLLPMAADLPEASFLGIDASARQVADGQAAIRAAGLTNIEIRAQDLGQFPADAGLFDYIICHGVYSWVPRPIQDQIMAIGRRHLHPNGVFFLSYNTYPGLASAGGRPRHDAVPRAADRRCRATKIVQSRALLDFLVKSAAASGEAYQKLLRDEAGILAAQPDSYLFHEHLEDDNEPLYFHQFVERAEAAGLQYLADADFSTMVPANFGAEIAGLLGNVSRLSQEQYLDFLRNRTFRTSLLCQSERKLALSIDPLRLAKCDLALEERMELPPLQLDSDEPLVCRTQHDTLTATRPETKAVLAVLNQGWPSPLTFEELVAATAEKILQAGKPLANEQQHRECLAQDLFTLLTRRLVRISRRRTAMCDRRRSPLPLATPRGPLAGHADRRRHQSPPRAPEDQRSEPLPVGPARRPPRSRGLGRGLAAGGRARRIRDPPRRPIDPARSTTPPCSGSSTTLWPTWPEQFACSPAKSAVTGLCSPRARLRGLRSRIRSLSSSLSR